MICSMIFYSLGEYHCKMFSLKPSIIMAFKTLLLWMMGSSFYLPVLYLQQKMAIMGSIWAVGALVITILMGILMFHESVTNIQIIGLIFAVLSIILLSIQ